MKTVAAFILTSLIGIDLAACAVAKNKDKDKDKEDFIKEDNSWPTEFLSPTLNKYDKDHKLPTITEVPRPPLYIHERPHWFVAGSCSLSITRDAYDNDRSSDRPFWMKAELKDEGGNPLGALDWTRCDVFEHTQTCAFPSSLNRNVILQPIFSRKRDYVQVIVDRTRFGTDNAQGAVGSGTHCEDMYQQMPVHQSRRIWHCKFDCDWLMAESTCIESNPHALIYNGTT